MEALAVVKQNLDERTHRWTVTGTRGDAAVAESLA